MGFPVFVDVKNSPKKTIFSNVVNRLKKNGRIYIYQYNNIPYFLWRNEFWYKSWDKVDISVFSIQEFHMGKVLSHLDNTETVLRHIVNLL